MKPRVRGLTDWATSGALPSDKFPTPSTFSLLSTIRKNSPPHIYSVTYLCQYGLGDSYFTQWIIIFYSYYLFWCSNCPRFGQWELLQAALMSFWHFCISLSLSLALSYFRAQQHSTHSNFEKKNVFFSWIFFFLKTNLIQCYILNVYIQCRNKLPLLCLPSTSLCTLKFPSVVILECREHTQHPTLFYHIQPGTRIHTGAHTVCVHI